MEETTGPRVVQFARVMTLSFGGVTAKLMAVLRIMIPNPAYDLDAAVLSAVVSNSGTAELTITPKPTFAEVLRHELRGIDPETPDTETFYALEYAEGAQAETEQAIRAARAADPQLLGASPMRTRKAELMGGLGFGSVLKPQGR